MSLPPSLGPVRQLGHVVENLDAAVAMWMSQVNVGPWTIIRNIELNSVYRGRPSAPVIDIALAYRGDQQIELIQQKNEAPSPYRPYIEQRHFGLHHHAYLSHEIHDDVRRCMDAGLELVCDINMPMGGGRYVYFATPGGGDPAFIELLEATWVMKRMFKTGIAAAAKWQGEGKPRVYDLAPLLRLMRWFRRGPRPLT